MSTDAATRFYERNFEWHASQGAEDSIETTRAILMQPSGRYACAIEYLKANPDCDVLELGCGSAAVAMVIGPLVRSYTMIDIVAARLGGAFPANVRTIRANLDEDFPVADASMDVVNAMMVIEHLYDPFHSFSELARVLRPGGRAFVNLPNIANIRCRLALLTGRLPQTSTPDWFERREWDGNHLHYFTVSSVRRIAAVSGLTVAALAPVGRGSAIKRLWPQLLCHEITFELHKA